MREGETFVLSTTELAEIATLQIMMRTAILGAQALPGGDGVAELAAQFVAEVEDLFPELLDPDLIAGLTPAK